VLFKRVIPVLLLDSRRRLVKTVRFGERTYVGDPFNVVRLFNEKEVDEICVLDIDATPQGRGPDIGFLRELSSECFMPLAYGGGITSMAQCEEARCVTRSAREDTGREPRALCRELQDEGVGEIILQSVDRDGQRGGYDLDLISHVSHALSIPVIALGGAGEACHLAQGLRAGASAVASGSAFVFIGRLRAVLVTYPDPGQVDQLVQEVQ